jgi:hypothetical protein
MSAITHWKIKKRAQNLPFVLDIMRCSWASVIITYRQDFGWAAGFLPYEMMG